jgi:ribose transport system substrate-binding protein
MKKISLGIVLVLTLALCVSAFAGGTQEPAKGAKPAVKQNKDIVVGLVDAAIGSNSYSTTHDKAFRARIKELGVQAIILDPNFDVALQQNQVEDLIQKKVDVIVIWPLNGKTIVPFLKKVHDAGIPCLTANSPADPSGDQYINGYCGPDSFAEGKIAGEMMVKALGGKGKVVELTGLPGFVPSIQRHDGFMEGIKGSQIELIDSQPADWNTEKAQKVMETYLTKYKQIDGIYGADDGICAGAMNALKAVGKLDGKIKITSATLFGVGWDAIKSGLMYASVYQSPILDAQITADTAVKLAKGEKIPFNNVFETPAVTKENVDKFERPGW